MNNCVIFVANRGYALTSSRTEIIQSFISSGWKVVVVTSSDIDVYKLIELGVIHEPIDFFRGRFSPIKDILSFYGLFKIYKNFKPALVHHFHAKPVIFGTLAAYLALGDTVKTVNTITGLGYAFINKGLYSKIAGLGYKIAMKYSAVTIFQNVDDQKLFLNNNWVEINKIKLIVSSGVNINQFNYIKRVNPNKSKLVITMIGRLLKQKGTREFMKVAENISLKFPDVRFLWAGEEELKHPDSEKSSLFSHMKNIEYLGDVKNILDVLTVSHILLFPSFREGVPRAVMEASATGLPIVAFDAPGVRECVQNDITGYLVSLSSVDALTEKIEYLINNENVRLAMGEAGSKWIKKNFDLAIIQNKYYDCYNELGINLD
ncbi:glycosyltransferase family 4 protein [Candidatus Thioglobus sp.]|nr:glycosyltransferase family 4 protein [Candidatus Thioglobus sp.]